MSYRFKDNFTAIAHVSHDRRTREQISDHYALEKNLASQLRSASKESRGALYGPLYEELFARLPEHPQHVAKLVGSDYVDQQKKILAQIVPAGAVFVEVGAGDARLSIAMSSICARTIAIDVTPAMLAPDRPDNFTFLRTDGTHFDIPDGTVDFVYSNQLMEHLHPDDAREQLQEIARILKPGGTYFCITPNRHSGPHDISKYFDSEATGFHLKEYAYGELASEMKAAGFRSVSPLLLRKGSVTKIPMKAAEMIEGGVGLVDRATGRSLRWKPKIRALFGINILAVKG